MAVGWIVFVLLFPISESSIRAPRARYTTKLVGAGTVQQAFE